MKTYPLISDKYNQDIGFILECNGEYRLFLSGYISKDNVNYTIRGFDPALNGFANLTYEQWGKNNGVLDHFAAPISIEQGKGKISFPNSQPRERVYMQATGASINFF